MIYNYLQVTKSVYVDIVQEYRSLNNDRFETCSVTLYKCIITENKVGQNKPKIA